MHYEYHMNVLEDFATAVGIGQTKTLVTYLGAASL